MSKAHRVWLHKIERNACDLLTMEGFDDRFLLHRGEALADSWPGDVVMDMNPDHPTDMRLVDSLFNIHALLVVSERLGAFLSDQNIAYLELLPVGIRDHKGKRIDADYRIVNLSQHADCLDASASGAQASLVPGKVRAVERLELKRDALPENDALFRLAGFGIPTVVSTKLTQKIDAEGFSGIRWGALADFTDSTW